ncbi:MAG TPA: c-type cytochrome [Steroidobacteraceae bacterium]|nr:c-type cytochrome [Steroidobacteraceae bacterium]
MRLCIALLASMTVLQACTPDAANSPAGFRLPSGDAAAGRQAFVDLRCFVCHQVKGVDVAYEGTGAASVALGGSVTRVKTYGELVTAIINPTHRVAPGFPAKGVAPGGESVMAVAGLNDVMTVRQLVDLVAFLQPQYKVLPPAYNPYTYRYQYH